MASIQRQAQVGTRLNTLVHWLAGSAAVALAAIARSGICVDPRAKQSLFAAPAHDAVAAYGCPEKLLFGACEVALLADRSNLPTAFSLLLTRRQVPPPGASTAQFAASSPGGVAACSLDVNNPAGL